MYKSRGSGFHKKKGLKGNYIDDADEERFGLVDIRQSLNKRYVVGRSKIETDEYTIFWKISNLDEKIYDRYFNYLKIELLNLMGSILGVFLLYVDHFYFIRIILARHRINSWK